MAFTAISSILTAGLIKLGYKFAENKKWLPKSIYHRLSVKKLKEGDLKQADYFNSIAIAKHPDYENALIMRDIIAMQKDANTNRLEKLITAEEDYIIKIKKLKKENEKKLNNKSSINIIAKILNIFIFLGVIFCTFIGINYLKNYELKYTFWPVILIILFLVLYIVLNRIFGKYNKIKETILWQERIATIETYHREIKVREKRIKIFKNDLKEILSN